MGTMTKWPVQKPKHRTTQKHVEHQDATDIKKKKTFLCKAKYIFTRITITFDLKLTITCIYSAITYFRIYFEPFVKGRILTSIIVLNHTLALIILIVDIMHLSIFCPPGGAAGIHGALDRRPFLTGGNLINLWNPGPG